MRTPERVLATTDGGVLTTTATERVLTTMNRPKLRFVGESTRVGGRPAL